MRDAASLLAGSPQAMTFEETAYSAISRVLARSTFLVDFDGVAHRLEDVQFGYDALGHLTRMTRQDVAHPPASVTTTWHYDNLDQVIGLEEPGVAPQFRSYDRWGALRSTHWCDPTVSSCAAGTSNRSIDAWYDARGRLVHSEEKTNGVVIAKTVKDFVYDQGVHTATPPVTATNVLGRLAKATAPTSAVSFSYDAFGRVNAQVFTDRTVPANNVYVQQHDYHGDGSLHTLHLLLPDNAFKDERVDYTYDSAGRTRAVTYHDGTAQSLFAASGSSDMYDVFGRLRKAQYAETTYTATYADTGRRLLTGVTVATPGGGGTREISFLPVPGTSGSITAFDPVGRERVRTEIQAGHAHPAMVSEYDALGRLANTSAWSNATVSPLRSFTYDALGNLRTQADLSAPSKIGANTLTYQTTDRDRICSIAYGAATPPAACNVAYDGVGNIVSQPDRNNHVRTFTYFPGGQVATIVHVRSDTTATFDYDAFGGVQRLVLNSPSAADTRNDRHFGGLIYRRDEVVAGVKTSVITRSIPGPHGLLATRHGPGANGPWTFTFGEAHGARFVTDRTGAVTQDLKYQPYGEVTSSGAQPGSPTYQNRQWNGGDALAALGLSQLGARLYDPVIGRFLSRDPLIIPRTAATTNPYAFADNDPVNRSDPTGLQSEGDSTGQPPPCAPGVCGSSGPGNPGGFSNLGHWIKCRFIDCSPRKPEPHTSTTTSGSSGGGCLGGICPNPGETWIAAYTRELADPASDLNIGLEAGASIQAELDKLEPGSEYIRDRRPMVQVNDPHIKGGFIWGWKTAEEEQQAWNTFTDAWTASMMQEGPGRRYGRVLGSMWVTRGYGRAGAPAFGVAKPLATQAEMVQGVRELEAGLKPGLYGPALPANYTLTGLQRMALAENVRRVIIKTIPAIKAGAGRQSFMNQLANPRFRFLGQIPEARAALINALKGTGVSLPPGL